MVKLERTGRLMIDFTPTQRKTIAVGITLLSVTAILACLAIVGGLAFWALKSISFAIVPVFLAFFLALFFKPYYTWWLRVVRNPTLALVLMLVTILVPISIFVWQAGAITIEEVSNLLAQGPDLIAKVTDWFRTEFPRMKRLLDIFGIQYEDFGSIYTRCGVSAMRAGASVLRYLSGIVTLIVTLILFVFFIMTKERKGSEVVSAMPFLKSDTKAFLGEQIDVFFDILVSFFQRQTVICLLEGIMYGMGFWLVGLPYGYLIGFALGVLNLIPLFGTVVCLPLAIPLAYFGPGGSMVRLILVLIVWAIGQVMDGYFITPRIQGNKTGLGYAGVIFSFFFWGTVLGPMLGMLLAIPLSAFCVVLWRAVKVKYIRPVV